MIDDMRNATEDFRQEFLPKLYNPKEPVIDDRLKFEVVLGKLPSTLSFENPHVGLLVSACVLKNGGNEFINTLRRRWDEITFQEVEIVGDNSRVGLILSHRLPFDGEKIKPTPY